MKKTPIIPKTRSTVNPVAPNAAIIHSGKASRQMRGRNEMTDDKQIFAHQKIRDVRERIYEVARLGDMKQLTYYLLDMFDAGAAFQAAQSAEILAIIRSHCSEHEDWGGHDALLEAESVLSGKSSPMADFVKRSLKLIQDESSKAGEKISR